MSLEGTQLGHYRLTRFLKGGGMGEVYLAEDLSLPREVAIKVVKGEESLFPNSQAAQEAERLFQREMKVIAALDHPNILALYEAGEQNVNHERITYMVMPYCPAGSLADWIRQYHGSSLLLPLEASQLLLQAGEALQYAHGQGILHLDIKPQNFLVRRQENPTALPNLLLADFGIAKIANTTKMTGTVRGTFAYMAPEQMAGQPGPASDQYALAIMTYELLTGKTPFDGTQPQVVVYQHAQVMPVAPSKMNPSLPSALDGVILKALAKKPEQRFPSVREFAQAFTAALKPSTSPGSGVYMGVPNLAPSRQQVVSPPPPPYLPLNVVPSHQQAMSPPSSPYLQSPPSYPPSNLALSSQQVMSPSSPSYLPPSMQVPQLSPQERKLRFWRAMLVGIIAGCLYYPVSIISFLIFRNNPIIAIILICTIPVIAGFITGRIGRRSTATLTGIISVIVFSMIYLLIFKRIPASTFFGLVILGLIGTFLSFIGGCIGTIGRFRSVK